jgi:RNA polymerase sigma-70 factor (ECF subfamily)
MVLELRIYDELPFKEVAELADCSENAAKVNFHHAVKKLRAIMGDDQEGPE